MRIDLNADVGERDDEGGPGDAALLGLVTSVNIVCGVHAGDPTRIRRLLRQARTAGVRVGAHPSLPDREGQGRRSLPIEPGDLEAWVVYQIGALAALARAEDVRLTHVKPHGALYHMAIEDPATAAAVARAVRLSDPGLTLVGFAGSALVDAGRHAGLSTMAEAFADRRYKPDGRLVPRGVPGALLDDPAAAAAQARRIAFDQRVIAVDGTELRVDAGTLCVHADTPGAAAIARAVRDALGEAGL